MEILSLLLIAGAAVCAAGAAWLIAAAKLHASVAEARLLRDRVDTAEADLKAVRYEANRWRTEAENEGRARAVAEASATRVAVLEADCEELRKQLIASSTAASGLEAKLAEQEQAHREKVEALNTIHTDIKSSFSTLAGEVLHGNQAGFFAMAKEVFDQHKQGASAELNALVSPIRETLQAYQTNLGELEKERARNNGVLSAEIRNVVEVGNSVRSETTKLVSALRASPKTRGRWGENTLRNVLELAELSPYCDFVTEQSFALNGALSRPDVVIHLPGGHSIAVDAKASMAAYLDAVEAIEEAERERHLKLHAQQLRSQVKLLAGKSYWEALDQTPDFVVMFVPGENFYAAAVERDPELFEFAFKHRVIIATPVTLIGLARVIAYNWRQEKVAENARRVHEIGRELYKRLATMGGHIIGLGSSLSTSVDRYNKFIGSLENSVMPQARRFSEIEVEGTGNQLAFLTPVDLDPRQLRSDRDFSTPALIAGGPTSAPDTEGAAVEVASSTLSAGGALRRSMRSR
jgi:DNA recombination protein RmuC